MDNKERVDECEKVYEKAKDYFSQQYTGRGRDEPSIREEKKRAIGDTQKIGIQ